MFDTSTRQQVNDDYFHARRRAFLRDARAMFGRRSNDLVPYHEIRRRFSPERESYRGVRPVPVDWIVGSMDRFRDFDRAFLPRQGHTAGRWKRIDSAYYEDKVLPPIQLYKIGDVYFVKDGNHRVSVARERGQAYIDAEVTEGHVRAPLYATMGPEELLQQAEYAEFLRRTELDRLRPDHDIRPTALGRYDEMWEHIELHRRWLEEVFEGKSVGREEAVIRWYDRVYRPIVQFARERGVTRQFPGATETDVYLWLMRRRDELYRRYTRTRDPVGSAIAHVEAMGEEVGWQRRLARPLSQAVACVRKRKRQAQRRPV
ncbi:MAG: hypothetical protein QOF73_4849 [Thermomicrobiales bacterium]|jgi:hypothetical protein|nr:hypothetical protein [Thermomicrobiales bacterium]